MITTEAGMSIYYLNSLCKGTFKSVMMTYLLRKPRSDKRHLKRVGIRMQSVERFRSYGPKHCEDSTCKLVANCQQKRTGISQIIVRFN